MRQFAAVLLLSICLGACKPTEESHMKAIIGALLIDGQGGPPVSNSIAIVAGERIRQAGPRSSIPVPALADKVDGSGKTLIPTLINAYPGSNEAVNFTPGNPTTADAARTRVAQLAAKKAPALHIWDMDPAIAQAVLEAARDAALPVVGHVSEQAHVRFLVDNGAAGFIGMITDTEDLDPVLLAHIRNLHLFFAPALTATGAHLEVAKRNTHRFFAAGIPVAAASISGDLYRETELLVDAGIPPLDVIVAATRNSAVATGQLDRAGTIQSGKSADMLLLSANPGEDIRNLRKVALRIVGGEWR